MPGEAMRKLVGRDPETVRRQPFLAGLGRGPLAVVEGEPGIGKTALWEAALPEVAQAQVLLARRRHDGQPLARPKRFPGAGHLVVLERAHEIAGAITQFVASCA